MVFATLLSKVFGMLRDVLLAANYGTTNEAIAYETASRLPILLFDFVIGGVVAASFIPIFNEILVKKDKKEAMDFANRYVNLVLVITTVLTLVGVAFSDLLVGLVAPDISSEAHALAASLSHIMFPMVIFCGLAFSFVGILQSLGQFNLPAIISLVSNGIMVLYFVFLNKYFGIRGLAVAMLIGWAAQAAVQIPSVRRRGYRYSPTLNFNSPYIKRSMAMALPILVSTWAQPAFTVIATRFASSLEDGRAIIAVGYANRLDLIIVGVFSFVATNLLFPMISRAEGSGDKASAEKVTNISSKLLLLVILPISVGAVILAGPIISLIYGRGEFTESDARLTATALRFFALGMPFLATGEILTKLFFAKQKAKIPMIGALAAIAADLVFTLVLYAPLGIAGIALASSLAVAVNMLVNYVFLRRDGGRLFECGGVPDLLKMLVSAAVMGVAVYFVRAYTEQTGDILSLIVSVVAGVAVYGIMIVLLGYKKYSHVFLKKVKK